jgi:hypothetical protein
MSGACDLEKEREVVTLRQEAEPYTVPALHGNS